MADEDLLIKLPEHKDCNHGITFDVEEAKKILGGTEEDETLDPAVAFIMGPVNGTSKIRKRFPRLEGLCPKGCGYRGIYYASYEHYMYGDW